MGKQNALGLHYSGHRLTVLMAHVTTVTYACLLVSSSKTKPCQFCTVQLRRSLRAVIHTPTHCVLYVVVQSVVRDKLLRRCDTESIQLNRSLAQCVSNHFPSLCVSLVLGPRRHGSPTKVPPVRKSRLCFMT